MLSCQGNLRPTLDAATIATAPHFKAAHRSHDCRESTSHITRALAHPNSDNCKSVYPCTCMRLLQVSEEDELLNVLWALFTDPLARAKQALNMQCETRVVFFFYMIFHVLCVVEQSEKLSQAACTYLSHCNHLVTRDWTVTCVKNTHNKSREHKTTLLSHLDNSKLVFRSTTCFVPGP